ncbi:hypothetical protein [Spiroplasma platyhelix]|uniref:Uncharacterized protein n=1 Tax=Spiroplasma platyhelix PALS-1 TaxID=1276218 RepID=A0A846U4N5_9MOLU|nr:hypothetical protein [Spiroplasma platyhelix]MBE4704047.1 hypothetical protein [Spiroplasma platyhelix PALS-1]NKE38417.1 hypothetical protein [Spiroplasma platyhelix PALS-1]UJB29305.1 hypothetical protein SPLAT_v1c05410 [Spiroplasma platyhelix PALS-1]
MKTIKLKSNWSKFPTSEKAMIILFLIGLVFLIAGTIMLLTVRVNTIFNGFNLVGNIGVIESLKFYESNNLANLIFMKMGIILVIFLMPVISGTSIIWFIINRLFF